MQILLKLRKLVICKIGLPEAKKKSHLEILIKAYSVLEAGYTGI